MTDINADNPRIQMWREFMADAPYKTAEKYKAMQNGLVEFIRAHGKPFSPDGAAEVIVALAERLGEVRNE